MQHYWLSSPFLGNDALVRQIASATLDDAVILAGGAEGDGNWRDQREESKQTKLLALSLAVRSSCGRAWKPRPRASESSFSWPGGGEQWLQRSAAGDR